MEISWPITEKPLMRSVLTMPGIMPSAGDITATGLGDPVLFGS
ncbi:hypothetical protein ABZW30_21775 [Kitasatospora sp. NPDC004669]